MFVEMMDTAGDYWSLFKRSMLTSESFDNLSGEERERSIRRQWAAFLEDDLPRIEEALKGEAWVWKPTGASGGR